MNRQTLDLLTGVRSPAAFADHSFVIEREFRIHIDHGEIGIRADTDGALLRIKLEHLGRVLRQQLDRFLDGEFSVVDVGHQHRNVLLCRRSAGVRLPSVGPTRLFLFPGVRRVIGRDHVQSAVQQTLPHSFGIMRLHIVGERVRTQPLDVGPIVPEPQRPRVDFRSYRTPLRPSGLNHFDALFRLQVKQVHVHAGGLLNAQQYPYRRVPDHAVHGAIGLCIGAKIVLAAIPEFLFDHAHHRLVVRMNHDRQTRFLDRLAHLQQLAMIVNPDAGHVRIIAPGIDHHEDLERHDPHLGDLRNGFQVGGRCVDVVVDHRLLFIQREHVPQDLRRRRRRINVGHRRTHRDASSGARRRSRDDVLFVCISRFAVMRVRIDHSRQHIHAGHIHSPAGLRSRASRSQSDDDTALYSHVGLHRAALRNHHAAFKH